MSNAQAQTAEVTTLPAVVPKPRQEIRVVTDIEPILDTGKFEHMQRIATIMARCELVPESLRKGEDQTAIANCFLVVNQAVRWGMDPFAVAQSTSVIHGKLCYEGKLVVAVMQKNGINLAFEVDDKPGDEKGIVVSGRLPGETVARTVRGTVGQWKTNNEQWKKDPATMLCYRGARAWARIHNPGPMLGIYTPDELEDISDEVRAARARPIALKPPKPDEDAPAPVAQVVEQQPVAKLKAPKPTDDAPTQDAKPAGTTPNAMEDGPAWIMWLGAKMDGFATYEDGENFWNDHVAAVVDALAPEIQEEAMGVWRKFEQRFES